MTIDLPNLEPKNVLELKHLAKSEGGLWVKGEVITNEIEFFAHSRHKHMGDKFVHISPDGEITEENLPTRFYYDDPWIKIGSIPTNRLELHSLCNIAKLDIMLWGITRHVVQLIALGWGDKVAEVVEWFQNPEEGIGITSQWEYTIAGPFWSPFHEEFDGCYFGNAAYEDGKLTGTIHVAGKEFPFESEDPHALGAFYVAALPVDTPS